MSEGKTNFVSNVTRRTWDLAAYEKKASESMENEEVTEKEQARRTMVVQRNPLKRRDTEVDLYSKIGKFSVITNSTPLSGRGGFWCEVCECLLKDSISYLDHINGKKHQRRLGMNLRPERATVDMVRARLEAHKRKRDEANDTTGVEARLQKFEEDAEAARQSKRRKKSKSDEPNEDDEDDDNDPDLDNQLADMDSTSRAGAGSGSGSGSADDGAGAGSGAGSSSSSSGSATATSSGSASKASTAVKQEPPAAVKEEPVAGPAAPSEEDIMAQMGFGSGFGTSKKGR